MLIRSGQTLLRTVPREGPERRFRSMHGHAISSRLENAVLALWPVVGWQSNLWAVPVLRPLHGVESKARSEESLGCLTCNIPGLIGRGIYLLHRPPAFRSFIADQYAHPPPYTSSYFDKVSHLYLVSYTLQACIRLMSDGSPLPSSLIPLGTSTCNALLRDVHDKT